MAAAERVRAAQRHDLAVVKPHAVEDVAQVVLALGAVRQAAVGRAEGHVAVGAPRPPRDRGALHLLEGAHAAQRPQVRVRDPRELLLHGFHEVARRLEPGVGAVVALGREPHRRAVGAARVGLLVVPVGSVAPSATPFLFPSLPITPSRPRGRIHEGRAGCLAHVPLACHASRTSTGP